MNSSKISEMFREIPQETTPGNIVGISTDISLKIPEDLLIEYSFDSFDKMGHGFPQKILQRFVGFLQIFVRKPPIDCFRN